MHTRHVHPHPALRALAGPQVVPLFLVAGCLLFGACQKTAEPSRSPTPSPIPVQTLTLTARHLPRTISAVGGLKSPQTTQVTADRSGKIVFLDIPEGQEVRQGHVLARYEQVILTGLEEVENALVAYSKEQVRQQWLTASITAYTDAVEISTERYLNGLENYLSVALARRALHTAQDAFAQSQTALAAHVIALYTALGGGWDTTRSPG